MRLFINGWNCGDDATGELHRETTGETIELMDTDDLHLAVASGLVVCEQKKAQVVADKEFLARHKAPEGVNAEAWHRAVMAVAEAGALSEVGLVYLDRALVAYEKSR